MYKYFFLEWSIEMFGFEIDFVIIEVVDFNFKLFKFYVEVWLKIIIENI